MFQRKAFDDFFNRTNKAAPKTQTATTVPSEDLPAGELGPEIINNALEGPFVCVFAKETARLFVCPNF